MHAPIGRPQDIYRSALGRHIIYYYDQLAVGTGLLFLRYFRSIRLQRCHIRWAAVQKHGQNPFAWPSRAQHRKIEVHAPLVSHVTAPVGVRILGVLEM